MRNLSIKQKSYGIFSLLFLAIFISGMVILLSLTHAREDAEIMNALGRQRMLAQEMAQSVFGFSMAKGQKKNMEQQILSLDHYITQMRRIYTESVIEQVQKAEISVSMNPASETHPAIPFPATFTRMVNKKFADGKGFSANIISENPVNPKQNLKSELDREANAFFKNSSEQFFSKIVEENGRLILKLYSADRATATACASCHSALQNKNVKVGDILGIRSYKLDYAENIALGKAELNASLNQYDTTKTMFEFTLLVMKLGGEFPLDRNLSQWKKVKAIPDADSQNKILEIEKEFHVLVEAVETLLNLETSSMGYRRARQEIVAHSNTLRILSGDLVDLYELVAKKNHKNIKFAVVVSGAFVLLVLIGLARYFTAMVIKPIQKISTVLNETAHGNLKQKEIKVRSRDEIGILSQTCNELTEGLQRFIRYSEAIHIGKFDTSDFDLEGDFGTSLKKLQAIAKAKINAEKALREAQVGLETRVKQRTSELLQSNDSLKEEISIRVEVENTLQQTNAFLQNLLESPTEISIVSTDNEGNILYWNPGAEQMLGYSAEEVVGCRNVNILYPEDSKNNATRKAAVQYVMEYKKASTLTLEEVTKSGDKIWVRLTLSPRVDKKGNIIGLLGIGENISSQKQAEMELSLSEERARLVIDTAHDAFVSVNSMGQIIEWNNKAEEIFGWRRDEVIDKELSETIVPVSYREKQKAGFEKFLETGKNKILNTRVELTALHREGHEFPVEISISPLPADDSYQFNAFIHDITERRSMETQLNHAQKMESIGQLAAGMAHEINTPMQFVGDNAMFLQQSIGQIFNTVKAHDRLLTECKNGTVSEKMIEEMEASCQNNDIDYLSEEIPLAIKQSLEGLERVGKIVKAMKEFSHPGSEEKIPTDINKAIETTLTVAKNEWKYVAEVVTDFDPNLPLVPCFADDFNQVILNSVVNAAHAIGDVVKNDGNKGTITLSTRQDGDWAEVRIQDTGTGIPENIRSKIFDPFFTTKELGKGTGQGLSIVHSIIVKKHQGTVSIETEDGKGTAFIFRFPLHTH